MNNRATAPSFGWNLGILSGVFAALQVLISAATARANLASIESMRWALSRLATGGGNPFPLLGVLAQVTLVAYASMVVTGAICLWLCWYAGRLTAYVSGRRAGGANAGFRVALLSGAIWIVFSAIISALLHCDGTITGVLASTPDGSSFLTQFGGLLVQEMVFGAIGLGLGAWAGHIGAGSAPLPAAAPFSASAGAPSVPFVVSPAYPPVTGYPVYGGYPITPPYPYPTPYGAAPQTNAAPPTYPPPPNYYRPAEAPTPPNSPSEGQAPAQ